MVIGSGSSAEERPTSRRDLLRGLGAGAAGAAAWGLSGCGSSKTTASGHLTQPSHHARGDARQLNRLLGAEYYAIAAYTAAIPLLSGSVAAAAKQFLGQEVLHADRLIQLIRQAGGTPGGQLSNYRLGRPGGTDELIRLLLLVERVQFNAYLSVLPTLSPGSVQATAASILANQAQHACVWRGHLGRRPAPSAFVTGSELT